MSGIQSTCTSLQASRQRVELGENGSYLQSTNEKIAAKTFEVKTKDEFDIWYKIEYLSLRREKGSIFLYSDSWAPIPLVNDV